MQNKRIITNKLVLFTLTLVLGLLISCNDSSTGPGSDPEDPADSTESLTGTLAAIVATNGSVSDADGYVMTLDDTDSKTSALNDTIYFESLEEGDHKIAISSIAEGCTADQAIRSVTIAGGDTTSVTFSVSCQEVQALNNKIVFTAQSGSYTAELFVMSADGSNVTEIDNGSSGGISQEAFPDVSPDGKKIAFVNAEGDYFNIFVENADGTGRMQLTDGEGDALSPDWSPDGSKIAFNRDDDIYTIGADGSNVTRLTETGNNRHPAWSPDGTQIAFMSFRDGDGEIFIMNSDGSEAQAITVNAKNDELPVWSPNGNNIAFTSYRDGQDEVYVMNADGSDQTRLTDGSGTQDSYAAWSPDGSQIAFRRHTQTFEELSYAIYVVNPDGSGLTELFKQDVSIRHLDWSPVQ